MLTKEQKDEFILHAVSGTTKTQLKRLYETSFNLSSKEFNQLVKSCKFKKAPFFFQQSKAHKIIPPADATCHEYPFTKIYVRPNFLTRAECSLLIGEIEQELYPSSVCNENDEVTHSDVRTSSSAAFNYKKTSAGHDLDIKIARYMGLDPFIGEAIQGQKYQPGEFYRGHHDYFNLFSKEYKTYTEWMGQRTWTFMIYLNDVALGGETYFKHLDLKIQPKQGTAVFWNNCYPIGIPNSKTKHEALPPFSGNKYIITKWFRSWPLI